MIRCTYKYSDSYQNYMGKGITICEEWKNYINFKKWAIENGYINGLSIDRKENDKGYCPSNCRFVTKQQNSFNRSGKIYAKSKYKGVSIRNDNKQNPYRARIMINKKNINIGNFKTEIEAALAYNKKAIELFGEFAYLNRIEK